MKYLWWRLRYTFWMFAIARAPLRVGWQCSGCDEEWFEYAPRDSVCSELSYWTE